MKTALLTVRQGIIADEWEIEHMTDERGNFFSCLVSKETKMFDGLEYPYRASSIDVYGHYTDVELMLLENPGMNIHIHNVRMEHLGEMVQWGAETFYAQTVEVMF